MFGQSRPHLDRVLEVVVLLGMIAVLVGILLPPRRPQRRPDAPGTQDEALPQYHSQGTIVPTPLPHRQAALARFMDEAVPASDRLHFLGSLPAASLREATDDLRLVMKNRQEPAALRNVIAGKLGMSGTPGLAADLRAMLNDSTETPQWRGYCVQHLYGCYDRGEDDSIPETLFGAAASDESEVRNTAVWNLALMATLAGKRRLPDDQLARLKTLVLAAIRDNGTDALTRTTGVQAADRLGLAEAMPDVRAIAADDNAPSGLRIPAIVALGKMGDTTDLPLLDRLARTGLGRLRTVAAAARDRLAERTANGSAGTE